MNLCLVIMTIVKSGQVFLLLKYYRQGRAISPFFIVSKNQLTKDEFRVHVLKLKAQLEDDPTWHSNPKDLAHKYLNKVLDIIDEYRY